MQVLAPPLSSHPLTPALSPSRTYRRHSLRPLSALSLRARRRPSAPAPQVAQERSKSAKKQFDEATHEANAAERKAKEAVLAVKP